MVIKEITLALGGGGVRGLSHLGVIRRLEKEGYSIRAIAGTSVGGVVGALFAAGNDPDKVENYLKSLNQTNLFSRRPEDGPSLMGLHGLTHALYELIGDCTFDQLKIPFACTAVDIHKGQEIILSHGRVIDSVEATMAFPGIFPPKQIGSVSLVDGGVLDPVPVSLARWLAPNLPVVAVCLSGEPKDWDHFHAFQLPHNTPIPTPILDQFAKMRIGQAFQIFARSMDVTSRMLGEMRLEIDKPDFIIRPEVERFGFLDNVNPSGLILLGDLATLPKMPELDRKMGWLSNVSRRFRRVRLPGKIYVHEPNSTAND